jgi:hypothetical protein
MPFVTGVFGMDGIETSEKIKSFRKAQAATAELPEFKGNVINVFTENFWPEDIHEIKTRANRAVQGKVKVEGEAARLVEEYQKAMEGKGRITPKAAEILKKLSDVLMTPEDLKLLSVGCSQQGYHYWGSAKFYCRAGKAFAEALVELGNQKDK